MKEQNSSLGQEHHFQQLIEKNADGILVLSKTGTILYVNPAAERLFCRPAARLVGDLFGVPLMPGEPVEIDLCSFGEPAVAEMRVVEAEWEGEPVYLASLRDVTERKRAQRTYQFLSKASSSLAAGSFETEATVKMVARLAVEHLADWCLIDLLETEDFVRRTAAGQGVEEESRLLPMQGCFLRGDMRDRGPLHVLSTGEIEVHQEVTDELLASLALEKEQMALIEEMGCRSVMTVPILGSGRDLASQQDENCPRVADDKHPLGVITFILSKAGRRYDSHQQTLAVDLAQRAALALENARLYEGCREGIHRRDQFLAMLGHELRNPLAPILTAAQTIRLRNENASEESKKSLTIIERQAKHLVRLVDDLLDLSRVSRGRIQLRRKEINFNLIVDDAIQASRAWIDSRKQKLYVHRESKPLMVKVDPTRLDQVIVNLLNNASRYTPKEGRIDLTVESENGEVILRVKDSGIGIPRNMLRRIFDPFTQVDATLERSQGGLGIGLALAQRLVQLHGGHVRAFSEGQGKGTELVLRLPLLENAQPRAKAPSKPPAPSCDLDRLHVLLVEDNEDGREMLRDLLKLWGHQVGEAAEGEAGLAYIREHAPDVALIDIGLPEMNGYDLVRKLRSEQERPSTLLVALTGFGQESDRQLAIEAGFDEHMVKPVNLEQLSKTLAKATNAQVREAR